MPTAVARGQFAVSLRTAALTWVLAVAALRRSPSRVCSTVERRLRRELGETSERGYLVVSSDIGSGERAMHDLDGLVVCLPIDWVGRAILAPVGKRITSRIFATRRGAIDELCRESKCAQGLCANAFDSEQCFEVWRRSFVGAQKDFVEISGINV